MAERERLPDRRRSWTQKLHVAGQTVYLGCGFYPDGRLGEIFLDVSKAGSDLRMTMHTLAMTFSVALQHGTPLPVLIDCLKGGQVRSEYASILERVAQVLEEEFLKAPAAAEPEVTPAPVERVAGAHEAGSGV